MSEPARWLYFDCYSGAAGDMLLGALLDVGLSIDDLAAALRSLPVSGFRLRAERVTSHGVTGTRLHVELNGTEQHHRHLADIVALLAGSSLPAGVIERATAVFRRLAQAEAAVHGTTVDEVHFHEVGAVDSIVDVTGVVWGLHALRVAAVYCSALPLGEGWIDTAHGRLPVPAPATLRLLAAAGAPTQPLAWHPAASAGLAVHPLGPTVQVEMVTPTAAALLAELAIFARPPLRLERVGYGFGARELPWPNAVRAWLGQPAESTGADPLAGDELERDVAVLMACNLDDTTGEALGYALERLLAAGALDVWLTPIQMKKNRPAVTLSVLASPEQAGELAALLLSETTTLGVRQSVVDRFKAGRKSIDVETPYGPVQAKIKCLAGRAVAATPEYDDCAALAREQGVPFIDVYVAAQAAASAALVALSNRCHE